MSRFTKCLVLIVAAWVGTALLQQQARADDNAQPSDFGFPVPSPEPELPQGVDPFDPPTFAASPSAPAIAEMSRTADRDEIVSMTGV
ncbi:MAG TPA: hypothetical protein VK602_03285, partial [Phyllobacterium sp.]|nr:hypothetical protein [Phyllobacterium sp.]